MSRPPLPLTKAERKYLDIYAEPEAALGDAVARARAAPVDHLVVIPAYGEGPSLDRVVASVPSARAGLVVVINARAGAPDAMRAANTATLARLRAAWPGGQPVGDGATLATLHPRGAGWLLLVERTLPAGQGVGLARKIGCDIAFAVWARGASASRWLHCTDADVELPDDYLHASREVRPGPALLYPFRHGPDPDPSLTEAVLRYEIGLRTYVLGLRWAGSRYAFHSVGSTLAVDASAYAQVRGFPRRAAGEDFYLLDKLAKLGPFAHAASAPLVLAGRTSARVPFGTGRAMLAASAGRAPRCYHPRVFAHLRALLDALAAHEPGPRDGRADWRAHLEKSGAGDGVDGALVLRCALALGVGRAVEVAERDCRSRASFDRRLREWLDGFRTRKLLHALRDAGMPSLPVEEAVACAPYVPACEGFDLEALRAALAAEEARPPTSTRQPGIPAASLVRL